jgi:hypothetical protein
MVIDTLLGLRKTFEEIFDFASMAISAGKLGDPIRSKAIQALCLYIPTDEQMPTAKLPYFD